MPAVKYEELRSPPCSEDSVAVMPAGIQARNPADRAYEGGQEDLLERPHDAENDFANIAAITSTEKNCWRTAYRLALSRGAPIAF